MLLFVIYEDTMLDNGNWITPKDPNIWIFGRPLLLTQEINSSAVRERMKCGESK